MLKMYQYKMYTLHSIKTFCFEKGFLCVTIAVLKLMRKTRLSLNSDIHYLCFPSAAIKSLSYHCLPTKHFNVHFHIHYPWGSYQKEIKAYEKFDKFYNVNC